MVFLLLYHGAAVRASVICVCLRFPAESNTGQQKSTLDAWPKVPGFLPYAYPITENSVAITPSSIIAAMAMQITRITVLLIGDQETVTYGLE